MLTIHETVASSSFIPSKKEGAGRETAIIFGLHNYDTNIFRWERVERARRLNKRLRYGMVEYAPIEGNIEDLIDDFEKTMGRNS